MTIVKRKPKLSGLTNHNKRKESNEPIRTRYNLATCAKRGKTDLSQVTIGSGLASDWLTEKYVCCHWLGDMGICNQLTELRQRSYSSCSDPVVTLWSNKNCSANLD